MPLNGGEYRITFWFAGGKGSVSEALALEKREVNWAVAFKRWRVRALKEKSTALGGRHQEGWFLKTGKGERRKQELGKALG